jgi:hypothetical protein
MHNHDQPSPKNQYNTKETKTKPRLSAHLDIFNSTKTMLQCSAQPRRKTNPNHEENSERKFCVWMIFPSSTEKKKIDSMQNHRT